MRLKDIRQYKGKFTGKLVKPDMGQNTRGFAKDDHVIVMHADDYKEYLFTIKKIKATWKDENSDDIRELREIAHIKFKNRKLNHAWKEAVRLFVKKNKHLLERRYDRLHQNY
jgi:hypothetical protein